MINLLIPFMALAAIGFLLSLTVHILALAGLLPPGGEAVFGLHIGIFVVWLPAVLISIRLNRGQRMRRSWKQMLAGCPDGMRYAVMGLFVYAFVNFFIAFSGEQPSRGHGSGISPSELRGFSGHWMLFYGMAFCILFSAFRKSWLLSTAKCPSGHEVAHSDTFCPTCGKPIPPRNA